MICVRRLRDIFVSKTEETKQSGWRLWDALAESLCFRYNVRSCYTHFNIFQKGAVMALKTDQLFVVSCGIALQAFILVMLNTFVAQAAGADVIWIAFQAWAVYFLAGCTVIGGIRALIGYATGIVASVVIIELMGIGGGILPAPEATLGMNLVMSLAVFLVVIPAIFFSEKLKNMVPALFIGSGAFFALTAIMPPAEGMSNWAWYGTIAQAELVYCAYGLLFGFITVFWRGKYEASLLKKTQ